MSRLEFRSDTMTVPTQPMRDAMRDAEVGDDVVEEDPTTKLLEKRSAELTGMEASLFVPSGTFGNQCAVGLQVRPGDEVLLSETTHVIEHENGAAAALWGAQTRTVTPTRASYLTADDLAPRIRNHDDVHEPVTSLIVLENALADGTVMPLDEMRAVRQLASERGIRIHLDGARLFNAALALGVPASAICEHVDTVTFCLSKGLGAPVGSMLCGTETFVHRARKRRKLLGGGMRQVGVLAAPALIALDAGVARLGEDHENARLLVGLLADVDGLEVNEESVQTNMVYARVSRTGKSDQGLVDFLASKGIDTYPPLHWGVRFVTSSRVNAEDVKTLAGAIREYFG
jgi:threonine aldolase